jgi:hypothetical protein
MRKVFVTAAAFAVTGAAFAQTGDDLMKMAFGNTVLIQVEGFYEGKSYYDPDHTYRTVAPEGEVRGRWRVDGDKLCLTQTEPAAPEDCSNVLKPRKVGDSWVQSDPATGVDVKITIVEGRK